jgi:hypothetical protein
MSQLLVQTDNRKTQAKIIGEIGNLRRRREEEKPWIRRRATRWAAEINGGGAP